MNYKKIIFSILFLLISLISFIILTGCKSNQNSNSSSDEKIIKEFRSHQKYSSSELKAIEIKYLGNVDNYKIYYVSYKEQVSANEKPFIKDNYIFPIAAQTRIVGIKEKELYTLGNMLYETQINVQQLYNLVLKVDNYK